MEIYVNEDRIALKKYSPSKACMITGVASNDNLVLTEGKVILSCESAKIVLTELEQLLGENSSSDSGPAE